MAPGTDASAGGTGVEAILAAGLWLGAAHT